MAFAAFRKRIEDLNRLAEAAPAFDSGAVDAVEHAISDDVCEIFCDDSPQYGRFKYFKIFDVNTVLAGINRRAVSSSILKERRQLAFEAAIPDATERVQGLVGALEEKLEAFPAPPMVEPTLSARAPLQTAKSSRVFVVHGHDAAARLEVARVLEHMDLEAVILQETANQGRTLIEKLEQQAVGIAFCVVLLTPDDVGYRAGAALEAKPRARQNVIAELGYFVALLGRSKVCALYKDVEWPSDFSGITYIQLDPHGAWKHAMAKELRAANLDADSNKIK